MFVYVCEGGGGEGVGLFVYSIYSSIIRVLQEELNLITSN